MGSRVTSVGRVYCCIVRQNREERAQKAPDGAEGGMEHNSRWMVEIIMTSFKRLLGEALRAVKSECMMIKIATKISIYNKTRYIMRKAAG